MSAARVAAVAGREFRSYFDQATAYILLVVFLVANFFFFFRTVLATGEAGLRPMFDLMPWLLLFFVPAVTMRSIAEERASGTIELVLSQPIREIEYLLGKFFGNLGFLAVALAGTVPAWFALAAGGEPFVGPAIAQYCGALLLSAAFVAIGLWASATTRNQITAFILAIATIFVFMALTLPVVLVGLPPSLAALAQRLGVLSHYANLTRGVLDLRDVVYFVSLTAVFLALAHLVVLGTRRNAASRGFRTLQAGVLGLAAIAVLANLLGGYIRGRLDLTPGGAYTLAEPTRQALAGLDDIVTIRFFASDDLPVQAESIRRDIEDLLADISAAGGDDVRLLRRTPEGENEAAREAEELGIPAVEFNTLGQGELQVRVGYLGVALEYADALHVIPLVQQTGDLEYRITSAILSMVDPSRQVVGLAAGLGGPPQDPEGGASPEGLLGLAGHLSEAYTVTTVDLSADGAASIPDSVTVLVLAGPEEPIGDAVAVELRGFLERGGNLFLMLQKIAISPSQQFTEPVERPRFDSLLAPYGVRVAPGMLVDLRSNLPLQITGSSGMPVQHPFPLFPVAVPASAHPTLAGVSGVALGFASPVDLSGADTTTVTPLLATTEFGAVMPGESPLDPALEWSRLVDDLRPRPVAAAVLPREPSEEEGTRPSGGRLVLVGDAEFVTNRFLARSPDNIRFARNVVDWLAADESLIGIRAKQRGAPPLLYPSTAVRDAAKYLTLVGVPLLFVLVGVARHFRRRRLAERTWRPAE